MTDVWFIFLKVTLNKNEMTLESANLLLLFSYLFAGPLLYYRFECQDLFVKFHDDKATDYL